jgi:hypothetical protein
MPSTAKPPAGPLVVAAEAFESSLQRFASLGETLRKGRIDGQRGIERAAQTLQQIAECEQLLQAHAQALIAALGAVRAAQQQQAEAITVRAEEIRRQNEIYVALMGRYEELGKETAKLNATAQEIGAVARSPEEMVRDQTLPPRLDDLQARMTETGAVAEALVVDSWAADFEELSRKVDSLRQQILATRNKIGLLREALARAVPNVRPS